MTESEYILARNIRDVRCALRSLREVSNLENPADHQLQTKALFEMAGLLEHLRSQLYLSDEENDNDH